MAPFPARLALCAAALLLLLVTPPARAQEAPFAALRLIVFDAITGERVRGASVALGTGRRATTGPDGVAEVTRLEAGVLRGEVSHPGYATQAFAMPLAGGSTLNLSVPLEVRPVELRGVEVEAEGSPARSRLLQDFYQRVRGGPGQYLTREEIDGWNARQISDLLRMLPGLSLEPTRAGDRPSSSDRSLGYGSGGARGDCALQIFVDGTPFDISGSALSGLDLRPDEVEGIEYYRSTSGVPARFRRANQNCGVLLIWKRERITR